MRDRVEALDRRIATLAAQRGALKARERQAGMLAETDVYLVANVIYIAQRDV
jgi:hypothetical protein